MSGLPSASSSSSSDRDSMAVLNALLKLKQQQRQNQAPESSAAPSSHSNPGVLAQNDTATNSPLPRIPQTMAGFSSPFASTLGVHPSLLGLFSTMDRQQNQYLASQLAAVAQSGSAVAAPLLPSSPMTSLSQQIQALQQATAGLPTGGSNMQFPSIASTENPISRADKQPPPSASPVKSEQTRASPSTASSKVASPVPGAAAAASVRQEKVDQALRSKPQRGKRRDDLSEKERMELTRTRNREHAKSTRLRKKARYQELLDSEEQLKRFQDEESMRQDRKVCLQKFLSLREAMLNGIEVGSISASSPAHLATPPELQELVDNMETFSFEIHGQKPFSTTVSSASLQQETTQQQGLMRMQRWDRDIRKRFRRQSGTEGATDGAPSSLFQYKLADGSSGVAISESGAGFARVDLTLQENGVVARDESEAKLVLAGILMVQFAPASSRMSSAIWTTTHHVPSFSVEFSRPMGVAGVEAAHAGSPPRDDPSSSSSNDSTLESQVIHPSVVSLEIKASHTDTTESQSPGPGMSI